MEIKGIGTLRNRPFRFENILLLHPDFSSNIQKWWAEDLQIHGSTMFLLHKILKHIKMKVKDWNKNEFENIFAGKKSVENKILELNQALIREGFDKNKNDQVEKYHQEWEKLCKQEEIFWKQKSRVQWLKEGECNTNFFHSSTIANRTRNRLSSIKDEDGQIHQSHENIEVVLVRHFRAQENILVREPFIKDFTKHIPKLVSREDNCNLNRPVSEKEVSEVLKEMQNGKAPGPNGFNVDFFKVCWNIIKKDIVRVVEDSRLNRTILKALNTSFIALIPKQNNAQTPERYRPIALCNVVYKIISKVAANRLKPLLPTLVLGEQSGYMEGRKILDNIIQAHEVVHSLTSKRKVGMIMQLDIAKAYDEVNWTYIRKVLSVFGFDHNWIRWVMALVTSSSFSILVNGSPSEIFLPSRGLRQGDPLSLFLFILMMEGLGRSIKHAKVTGKIQGLQLSENGQVLTHQLFVDDTMLEGIPIVKEALAYKQILNDFSMAAGMEVNISKSKLFFFNTHIAIQRNVSRILGFQRESLPSKYLGVPLTTKPLHKSIWESLIIKMQDKVRKWTIRSLNLASRLVLTKGFPIWNKAWENKGVVQKNSFWEIRDGDHTLFWEDKWQQEPTLLKEEFLGLKHETDNQGLVKVKDFWDQAHNTGKWRTWKKINGREDSTLNSKAKTLKQMMDQRMILVTEGQDQLKWGSNKEGNFNIKEEKGILLGLEAQAPVRIWQKLWRSKSWMKIKLFMWLVHHRKILTWDNIRKRGMLGPSRCQLCEAQEETMEHLLNSCIFTSRLWDFFATLFKQSDRDTNSITNTLNNWRNNVSNNEVLNSAWALLPSFTIWNGSKERNKRIFKERKFPLFACSSRP
eukprot:PITA_28919